jgi:type VI secretion system protein ImpK
MRDDLAKQVYPVLEHGLKMRAKLNRGEHVNLFTEQAELKRLLGSNNQPAPWGAGRDINASISMEPGRFLGIRYALTCWLDEIFIDETPFGRQWDENKLELSLFETNIRYRNFWEQARQADSTADATDSIEAFLLCVLLGFRGELADRPDSFREWVSAAKSRSGKGYGKDLPAIPETTPSSNVPLLMGGDAYRRMSQRLGLAVLAAIPVVTFLCVLLFR